MRKLGLGKFAKKCIVGCLPLGLLASSFAATAQDINSNVNSTINNKVVETKHLHAVLDNNTHKAQFKFILNKLKEFHLPKELALIPVIESHYNSKAVSGCGAGGLWQLMPATAKELGITNKQRFELGPSTQAALTYFKQLHQKLGNWELVLAAYNAGSGRVQKALKKNPAAKSVQQLHLPTETKNYVLRFNHLNNELKYYQV